MKQRIIFSPSFSSRVYKGFESGESDVAMMDWQVMGTKALIAHVESLMGKQPYETQDKSRLVDYYVAARRQIAAKGQSSLAKSFDLSGLSVAREMLRWRDALAFCGYDFSKYNVSERIDILNDIEASFKDSRAHDGMAERIWGAIRWIGSQDSQKFDRYDIATTARPDLFHPTIGKLIKSLELHGAHLSQLDSATDNALEDKPYSDGKWNEYSSAHNVHFLHFDDKKDADEYLALYGDALPNPWCGPATPTLWINPSNNTADNWLKRYKRKQSGSETNSSAPLTALLPLSFKIQHEPLDIQFLLDWLQLPMSPIDKRLRSMLAGAIASTGGCRNDSCRSVINGYLDSIDEARRHKAEKAIEMLLPSAETAPDAPCADDGIRRERLSALTEYIGRWAAAKVQAMRASKSAAMWIGQLNAIRQTAEAMQRLAENAESDSIKWDTVDSWASSLSSQTQETQYEPQVGCRPTVTSPSDMAAESDLTVWTNLAGDEGKERDCDFLTSDERDKLTGSAIFWDAAKEDEYNSWQTLLPLAMSHKLIIVHYDHAYGQPVRKHRLLMMLEKRYDGTQDADISSLSSEASIPEAYTEEATRIDNRCAGNTIKIATPEDLPWPSRLSYTSLDQVINHPSDFVLERMLDIRPTPRAEIDNLQMAKGRVAHAVICSVCQPRGSEAATTSQQIGERMASEFEQMFQGSIDSCGALLRKAEHMHDVMLMRDDLRRCIETLSNIISLNHLEVTACERSVSTSLALFDAQSDDDDAYGFIDMTLRDTTDGSDVIFDFKWTRSAKTYKERLAEGGDLQLELYRQMLKNVDHKVVGKVAYFVMPAARLYSRHKFEGADCEQVTADTEEGFETVKRAVNSFHYRKNQIDSGIIEIGEGGYADELDYVQDTDRLGLLPLRTSTPKGDDIPVKQDDGDPAYSALRR